MSIEALIEVLEHIPKGRLAKDVRDKLIPLLSECWHDFEGSSEASMREWKLDRDEDFFWNPPVLSFTIERHGATVLGSSRADIQRWKLNLTTRDAQCSKESYRQIHPASPKLDVKPIASRVCETIREGSGSNSDLVQNGVVVWKGDDEVWVYHGKLIRDDGYQQTVAGRRKRFRDELTNIMKPLGWKLLKVRQAMIFKKEA
jgi:hypothetical protein